MKKIALLFSIIMLTTVAANAFVDNQYMTTEQYMVNTGYSAEMAKMMAVTNQDPYRDVYVEPKTLSNVAKRIYWYIVPGVKTDYDFYNRSGVYNNTSWRDL